MGGMALRKVQGRLSQHLEWGATNVSAVMYMWTPRLNQLHALHSTHGKCQRVWVRTAGRQSHDRVAAMLAHLLHIKLDTARLLQGPGGCTAWTPSDTHMYDAAHKA